MLLVFTISIHPVSGRCVTISESVLQIQESGILPDMSYQPDGSISLLKKAGEIRWIMPVCIPSNTAHLHLVAKGTVDRPLMTNEWLVKNGDLFINNNVSADGNFWIQNTYLAEDGILAFVHVEQAEGTGNEMAGRYSTGKSRIGIAWSTNGGEKFNFLGNIIIPSGDPIPHNIQGVPYIVKDGYLYIYFHDTLGNTVARAPLNEVIQAARMGKTSIWKKFNGADNGFSSAGLGGPSRPIGINAGITHTDAACSIYNNKCYLLLTRMSWRGEDTWIRLYETTDAVNWTFIKTVVQQPAARVKGGYQYATITNVDGNDNGTIGSSFFVYSQKNHQDSSRSIYRWTVNLDK